MKTTNGPISKPTEVNSHLELVVCKSQRFPKKIEDIALAYFKAENSLVNGFVSKSDGGLYVEVICLRHYSLRTEYMCVCRGITLGKAVS